ncbi:hypothetical protein V5799_002777 [Amblyomma americanum]|uniref:Uncharacterized protein n=1 Tax=Amblyomma americanum TaxID=6943 RepID=A0AAQ4DAU9_AMBAM
MTGLTREFRGSRNSGSGGESSATSGKVTERRLSIITGNVIRLNRFLALLTLHLATAKGQRLSPKGSTRRSCCDKHRDSCKKAKDSVT